MNAAANQELLIIEPGRSHRSYWRELWSYRDLLFILAWRDLTVRYRQTIIGVAWAVIRPALTVAIFTVVFGKIAKLPSPGQAPYALMVFAGLIPWTLFSTTLGEASASLVVNANLIGKVYFPRMIVPIATMAVSLADTAVSLILFFALITWYGHALDWKVLVLPFLLLIALITSLGPALLMCAMNVKYRDFRYVIPFTLQLGLYVSPVGFSSTSIPAKWQFLYSLNPLVGMIDSFRWALLRGDSSLPVTSFATSLVSATLMLLIGVRYFRATERGFADVL